MDNEKARITLIQTLKGAYRNRAYLDWLKSKRCWSCNCHGSDLYNPMTPSHIGRSYHAMKNHDWASIPQCFTCHHQYEYFRYRFEKWHRLPELEDAERYFQEFLAEMGRTDDREANHMKLL